MLDPLHMYTYQMAEHQRAMDRNQNILHRQLFQQAINHGLIEIDMGQVVVLDQDGAVAHFSHHPDLFLHIPFNPDLFLVDKEALERTLTQAWRSINS